MKKDLAKILIGFDFAVISILNKYRRQQEIRWSLLDYVKTFLTPKKRFVGTFLLFMYYLAMKFPFREVRYRKMQLYQSLDLIVVFVESLLMTLKVVECSE